MANAENVQLGNDVKRLADSAFRVIFVSVGWTNNVIPSMAQFLSMSNSLEMLMIKKQLN